MADILQRLGKFLNLTPENIESAVGSKMRKSDKDQILDEFGKIYRDHIPCIAFIGKSGVGKTSTINVLFNPVHPLPIGHVKATTRKPHKERVWLGDDRGYLDIYDMPGLGESITVDPQILRMYAQVLPECDAALWILQANERSTGDDQQHIKDVAKSYPDLRKKLVIGLNQVDLIWPGDWNKRYNVPSLEQAKLIQEKIEVISERLKEIGVEPQAIVPYSALKKYRLTLLFEAILEAVPLKRAWLLGARVDAKSYARLRSPHDEANRATYQLLHLVSKGEGYGT